MSPPKKRKVSHALLEETKKYGLQCESFGDFGGGGVGCFVCVRLKRCGGGGDGSAVAVGKWKTYTFVSHTDDVRAVSDSVRCYSYRQQQTLDS